MCVREKPMRRLVTLLVLLAFLVACNGPANPPGDATGVSIPSDATANPIDQPSSGGDVVTISYAAWESERAVYEPLANKFNAENPSIKVALVPLDDMLNVPSSPDRPDNPTALLRRIVSSADTAPSFFLSPDSFASSLLMDLTPMMEADASFQRDDFYPGALEQYAVKGGLRMLPRYLNVQVLSYNKDLFSLANLPEPKAGWTWNDLLGAAEQIARKNGSTVDTYGFLDQSGGFLPLVALLDAQGIDLLNTPSRDLQLTQPGIVDAVEHIRDLSKSGALFQPFYGKEGPGVDMQQLLRDGKVGMWSSDMTMSLVSGRGPDYPQPAEPFKFQIGSVPYPGNSASFFFGGSDGYVVSAGTEHPNEAWKWIEFLSRTPIEQVGPGIASPAIASPQVPGRVPARKSLAEATSYWKNIDEPTAAAYRWAIEHPARQPAQMPDFIGLNALSQALSQIVGEDKDPAKALAEAQKQLQDQLAEVQLTPSPTPDNSPVLVATPEPQEVPEGATAITFAVPGYSTSDMRRIVRSFQQQHPELFVKITSTETYSGPLELKDVAQKNDCFTWFSTPQSDADFKALLDIQPLFDADAGFPQSDYPAALLSPYQRNGGLFGLPYAFNVRTLNYNRTAFDAAGLKSPSYDWKPADFLAAAQSLTSGEGDTKQYGYVSVGSAPQDLFFFIGQFGGRLISGGGKDVRPNFDDPKVIEAIQWYLDLAGVHKVMPPIKFPYRRDDPGNVEDRSYDLVQNGRAGMWFDQGYGMFEGSKTDDGNGPRRNFEIGVAPLPIGGGGLRSTDFYERGFHISANTQQAQGCWELIKFLSGDVTGLQGSLPARVSVAKSDSFTSQAQPSQIEIYNVYADALKRESQAGDDLNALYGQRIDLYWFFKAIGEAIEGTTNLDKGLAEAQKMTNAYIDCQIQGGEPPACATQVDPTYQGFTMDQPKGEPGSEYPRG